MHLAVELLETELSKLKDAVLKGTYGPRGIVADAVINMEAALSVLKENIMSQQITQFEARCESIYHQNLNNQSSEPSNDCPHTNIIHIPGGDVCEDCGLYLF